jgi:vitamin K-dependent gamma-carboxylase-like protein
MPRKMRFAWTRRAAVLGRARRLASRPGFVLEYRPDMRAWQKFTELYLSVDRRVLGAFRVGYGLVLLCDLARRAQVLELYYSNDGVLSNHYVMFSPQDAYQFSLLDAFSTPGEVRVAFALIAVIYGLLTLGWHTRLAQVLALLALTSLNARNLFAEDGGVATLIALGVWTVFMPLGQCCSLDALITEARLPDARERVRWRARLGTPFVSLAVLAASLQLLAIYWLNAAHKTGATWQHGDAVHYVLWQRRVVTDFGFWLAQHEPSWLSPLATRGTLILEWLLPALALAPFASVRVLAFALAVLLHGGIAATLSLGPFSYAMLLLVFLRFPASALEALARRAPLRRTRWRARARAVRWLRRLPAVRPRPPAILRRGPVLDRAWARYPRELLVVVLAFVSLVDMSAHNRAFPLELPRPRWARSLGGHLRLTQRWGMFAPDVPVDDGAGVIDAVTVGGRHVDPLTGLPPNFEVLERGPLPHGSIAADYLFVLTRDQSRRYRQELTRSLQAWHERDGRTPQDRIVRYEVWWLTQRSPPPGSTEPGPTERERVVRWP